MQSQAPPAKLFNIIIPIVAVIVALIINDNRSLWLDEAMLANNIFLRTYQGLLQPLALSQAAPIGYLFLEKTLLYILPDKELALRLPSLLCYMACVFLFYKAAFNLFKNIDKAIILAIIFLLNIWMIRYSYEVKPYIFDVLVAVTFLYFYSNQTGPLSKTVFYGIMIFFSNIVVIFLASEFLVDVFIRKKRNISYFLRLYTVPGILFLAYYYTFFMTNRNRSLLLDYWIEAKAFPAQNIFSVDFWLWCSDFIMKEFCLVLGYNFLQVSVIEKFKMFFPVIAAFIFLLSAWGFLRSKNKALIAACILPVFMHFVFSYLRLYPTDFRLCLYQAPLLLVVIMVFINGIPLNTKWLYVAVIPFVGLCTIVYPFHLTQIREGLSYIEEKNKMPVTLVANSFAKPTIESYLYLNKYKTVSPSKIIYFEEGNKAGGAFMNNLPLEKGRKYYVILTIIPSDKDPIIQKIKQMAAVSDVMVYKSALAVGFYAKD